MTNDLIPILMDIADKYFGQNGREMFHVSDEKLVIEELQEYLSGFSHEQIQGMADEFKSAGLTNVSAMLTYYMTHHASHDLSLSAVNPSEVANAITEFLKVVAEFLCYTKTISLSAENPKYDPSMLGSFREKLCRALAKSPAAHTFKDLPLELVDLRLLAVKQVIYKGVVDGRVIYEMPRRHRTVKPYIIRPLVTMQFYDSKISVSYNKQTNAITYSLNDGPVNFYNLPVEANRGKSKIGQDYIVSAILNLLELAM
jgi:hypothetical protein